MADISIVPATYDDLASIGDLLQQLIDIVEDNESFNVDYALRNCRTMLHDGNAHVLVAKERDAVVGFINFATRKTILHKGSSGLIDELVVAKECRGRGVGRKLVGEAVAMCKALGCSEIEVSTEKSNRAARRFYAGCGFEEEAVLLERHLED